MPRQSSRRPAPSSSSSSSSSRSIFGGRSQARPASTMAAPAPNAYRGPNPTPAAAAAPVSSPAAAAAAPRQPGLFAQMASTAAGVAVGSAVGHTLGAGLTGMFSSSEPAPPQVQQAAAAQASPEVAKACDVDARNFTRCLEDSNGNYQSCDFYLQQLKACQAAASQY
ncbi:Mix17 protein [Martiniozyma asiatica (nom. inval.)]|nr:Mix17 protein [Martiniozyma asiatica]